MQVEIKAQEDENFKFTTTDETDDLKDDSHVSSATPEQIAEQPVQPEPPKRREATLNNPSGHEWFNGTSWGLK
jgi:hypothetical protein